MQIGFTASGMASEAAIGVRQYIIQQLHKSFTAKIFALQIGKRRT